MIKGSQCPAGWKRSAIGQQVGRVDRRVFFLPAWQHAAGTTGADVMAAVRTFAAGGA